MRKQTENGLEIDNREKEEENWGLGGRERQMTNIPLFD